MDGGLALMCFRMLLWVCSLALVFSKDTTKGTATIKILPEKPHEGDNVILLCDLHDIPIKANDKVIWYQGNIERCQNHVYNDTVPTNPTTDSHLKYPIASVQQNNTGHYQCRVARGTVDITRSKEYLLIVYGRDEILLRFPDDPATAINVSSLSIMMSSDNGGSAHGNTFQCNKSDVSATELTCTIHRPTDGVECTQVPSNPTVIVYILVGIVIILIIIIIILIILLFLRHKHVPRCWKQLRGKLRRSSTPRQGNNRHDDNPKIQYEIPIPRTATPQRVIQPPEPVTPGTTSSPCRTARHFYHNRITEPTSSS